MRYGIYSYGGMGGSDSGPTRMEVNRPTPPVTKSNTGNAAMDGYTVEARRVRGDMPGDMVDAKQADAIESSYNDGPLNDF